MRWRLGAVMLAAALGVGCTTGGSEGRRERASELAALFRPAWVPAGVEEFESITDGGPCGSDCPPPAVSWSYVCACPDLGAVLGAIQEDATRSGWRVTEGGPDDGFLRARREDGGGQLVELSVLTWSDAVEMQPGSAELQRLGRGRQALAISLSDT